METVVIVGYCCAFLIGTTLGLMGGGGSILALPVLVYLLGINASFATTYSLFVVGVSALVGAFQNWQKEQVDFKTGISFAIPSLLTLYIIRLFVLDLIPDQIAMIGNFVLTKDFLVMVFFGIVMMSAARAMLRPAANDAPPTDASPSKVAIQGLVVGIVTGFVGAGGGFLIVPALALWAGLPMKKAVGTSLLVIAINSLLGFAGDAFKPEMSIDWAFLGVFAGLAMAGMVFGTYLGKYIPAQRLKTAFGYFVLIMAVFVLAQEFLK